VVAVELLTIGEFARMARLSPKALRLYDELGLLRPHAVDSWSGYRYYAPEQLEKARLIAWLRRLRMPLARIRAVLDLTREGAVAEVTAFSRTAEADFAERQRLAQFLIGYLSEGTRAAMTTSPAPAPLAVRYAAASDQGLVRERNQDASYAGPLLPGAGSRDLAGPMLLAVADGCGPDGERASALVIDALRGHDPSALFPPEPRDALPAASPVPADLLNALSDVIAGAASSVRSLAPDCAGSSVTGSTLTAMYLTGSQLALVHIGDSRAYLLRDGGLFQITHDDSVTQAMVDAGQLTPEEAASHPQRSLLLKAIGGTDEAAQAPALSLHEARAGDRYLLTTDGLTSVVPVPAIRAVLRDAALSPQEVVTRLIALANEAGGPDNIACAVADVAGAGADRAQPAQ
jgi:serine/threonine protein phosphatase PrpC/DNA-binding transcriptional MerR regulator